MDLDKHIETDDTVYTCHVTAQDNESNDHDKVQVILEQYRDVFPDELPAELPPEKCLPHHSTQGQQCCSSCTQII